MRKASIATALMALTGLTGMGALGSSIATALMALTGLSGMDALGSSIATPQYDGPPLGQRHSRGGKKEHSKRHTGQAKIRRDAKRRRLAARKEAK